MRIRLTAAAFICLGFLMGCGSDVQPQSLPQDCREAMDIRSPQTQIDLFTRCLETGGLSGPERGTTLKQRAVAYMHLGQHKRALDDINQALRLRPGDADVYYLRSVSERALGDFKAAVDDSTQAISIEPNNAAAYASRAYAHKELGNAGQARNDARRARELDKSVKVPWF